ncbi:unnamed protein product, partial [Symbiodinium necroappetens]
QPDEIGCRACQCPRCGHPCRIGSAHDRLCGWTWIDPIRRFRASLGRGRARGSDANKRGRSGVG